jgi:acetyl-CoA carboxylase biotin carboxylase subunit
LIVHAENREEAIKRMAMALDEYIIEGIKTTIPFHKKMMANKDFIDGNFDTNFLERTKI